MSISNFLLAVIAVLLMAIYVKNAPLEMGRALAGTEVSGRYQVAAAGESAPKAFILDTAQGKVWVIDTSRIIKTYDLLRDL
ncbi:MAG TPA: hypothetical protein ACFYD3_11740 [Candidatus Hypogeohydataceae bacterium YC41]